MKKYVRIAVTLALLLAGCRAPVGQASRSEGIVDEGPKEHLLYRPDDIEWQPGPASFEQGSQYAVLEGDPAKPGVFTMRFRLPDGFHISPHWHLNVERVTVISGRFRLGMGEQLDREATTPLEPGSYTSIPRQMRHYAVMEGPTEIQLTSVGPWIIQYVNPEDDPRLRN